MIEHMFDSEVGCSIPPDLDEMPPGPELAAVLAGIDVNRVAGPDRVMVLRSHQRLASHYQAHVYRDMAAVSDAIHDELDHDPELAHEAATAEVGVALRLTRRAAELDLDLALDLRRRLPTVWELIKQGRIDLRRARVLVQGTDHLSVAAARAVMEGILEEAPGLTTGQLQARLRRMCLEVNPEDAQDRYRQTVDGRRVVSEATVDGTAHLFGLDLPPTRVAAARRRINRLATSLRGNGETRSIDQLRADVLLDLLTGSRAGASRDRGMVDIHVDLQTLAGLSEQPGELAGYGPVIADIARQVADEQPRAEWRYTVTNDTGRVVASGITRRRPTTAQRREVQAASPACVFPGCRVPATDCDLDHATRYTDSGPTTTTNLDPLCRRHHRLKDQAGWSYRPGADGTHRWTTPLGHTYTTSTRPP